MPLENLLDHLRQGDVRSIARAISMIENEAPGYAALLEAAEAGGRGPLVGITGPPGAGKSTLVDGLVGQLVQAGKRVAVLCVDPSSPFHRGALLGDRIRLSAWYNHPAVFIRSLASRGAMGGLHPSILEISSLLGICPFDYIIVETVGVGQSEVEIAGLADVTVVVMVPEAGDDIQAMKSGLMEVADVFVVNKSDRPDADRFTHHLRQVSAGSARPIPVVQTVASKGQGLDLLWNTIQEQLELPGHRERQLNLLAERAYELIRKQRMRDIAKADLREAIAELMARQNFNLYSFVKRYYHDGTDS